MPWREVTVVSQRREFVTLALQPGSNVSELCRRFGIAPKTGYKWIGRFLAGGRKGLLDRSRRPHRSPWRISAEVEEAVLAERDRHPAWGPRKLRARLQMLGHTDVPAPSTVAAILRRNGRIDQFEATKHVPWQRFEHAEPNALWQMDFKGEFRTDAGYCYPLTVLDDHSRYSILLEACPNQGTLTVKESLIGAFGRYGLPCRMLVDNGPPWSGGPGYPYTPLTAWLMHLGVRVVHSRVCHPQTHGKDERFHRTLQAEVLQSRRFADLCECRAHFSRWREVYNHERPHEALGMAVPASRYRVSVRRYPSEPAPVEYGPGTEVRRVQQNGTIYFGGGRYKVGRAFWGYPVGVRPTPEDGVYDVYFCREKVRQISLAMSSEED